MPNMSESQGQPQSLGEYIQSNQQQVVAYDSATGQGITLSPSARVNEDAPITGETQGVQATPDAGGGQGGIAGTQGQPAPVAPQPGPEMDELRSRLAAVEAERDRTNNLLVQQAQQAARAEQARFMQSLEGLEPDEKRAKLLQFQNQQLLSANQALNARISHNEQQAETTRQQIAKTQVAHAIAFRDGLPPDAVQVLLQAPDPENMERSAAWLKQQFAGRQQSQQQQARQQFVQGDAYRPTGDNASSPVPPGPKKRSGDLQGLIGSRSYSVAPASGN